MRYRRLKDSHGIIGARDARSIGQIRAALTVVQPMGRSTLSLRNTRLPNEFAMCCRHSAQRYVIVGPFTVHLGPALGRASNRSRRRWPTNTWKCAGFSLFRLQPGRFRTTVHDATDAQLGSLSKCIPSVSSDGTSPLLSVCQGTSARRSQPTSLGWRPEPSKPRRSR